MVAANRYLLGAVVVGLLAVGVTYWWGSGSNASASSVPEYQSDQMMYGQGSGGGGGGYTAGDERQRFQSGNNNNDGGDGDDGDSDNDEIPYADAFNLRSARKQVEARRRGTVHDLCHLHAILAAQDSSTTIHSPQSLYQFPFGINIYDPTSAAHWQRLHKKTMKEADPRTMTVAVLAPPSARISQDTQKGGGGGGGGGFWGNKQKQPQNHPTQQLWAWVVDEPKLERLIAAKVAEVSAEAGWVNMAQVGKKKEEDEAEQQQRSRGRGGSDGGGNGGGFKPGERSEAHRAMHFIQAAEVLLDPKTRRVYDEAFVKMLGPLAHHHHSIGHWAWVDKVCSQDL